jgi:hypothetical protein
VLVRQIVGAILATDMSHHFDMCSELAIRSARDSGEQARPVRRHSDYSPTARPSPRHGAPSLSRRSSVRRTPSDTPPFDRSVMDDRRALVKAIVHRCGRCARCSVLCSALLCSALLSSVPSNSCIPSCPRSADLSGQAYPLRIARNWGERIVMEFNQQAEKERREGLPVAPFMADLTSKTQVAKLQLSFIENITLPLWQRLDDLVVDDVETPLRNMLSNRLYFEAELLAVEQQESKQEAL